MQVSDKGLVQNKIIKSHVGAAHWRRIRRALMHIPQSPILASGLADVALAVRGEIPGLKQRSVV